HRPELRAIAGRMNAARVRRLPRKGNIALKVYSIQIARRVEPLDRLEGNGGELLAAFGHAAQRRRKAFLFPLLLQLVKPVSNDIGIGRLLHRWFSSNGDFADGIVESGACVVKK